MPDHYRQTRTNSSSSVSSSNVVGVHYKVGRKIGEGSFGIIYEGINLMNNQQVAIKFESRKSNAPQLRMNTELIKFWPVYLVFLVLITLAKKDFTVY
ncbi:unnamed protein product [Rhizopus stolonifer]